MRSRAKARILQELKNQKRQFEVEGKILKLKPLTSKEKLSTMTSLVKVAVNLKEVWLFNAKTAKKNF